MSHFDPKVRYSILRLRLEHPFWGADRIRERLKKQPTTSYLSLPSLASIGRYLHQWPRFRWRPKPMATSKRLSAPTHVHQRWQLDFKTGIALKDGTLVNLHTVRDPFGEACLGAFVFPAGESGSRAWYITWIEARSVLRMCFARWHTLPDEVQTDGEPALIGRPQDNFPSLFTPLAQRLGNCPPGDPYGQGD